MTKRGTSAFTTIAWRLKVAIEEGFEDRFGPCNSGFVASLLAPCCGSATGIAFGYWAHLEEIFFKTSGVKWVGFLEGWTTKPALLIDRSVTQNKSPSK